MKHRIAIAKSLPAISAGLLAGAGSTIAAATEPCGDLGECKALIEINSTDGDIGFHFLMDGDDLNSAPISFRSITKSANTRSRSTRSLIPRKRRCFSASISLREVSCP